MKSQVLACIMLVGGLAPAQLLHPAKTMPSFSVVSVRPSSQGDGEKGGSTTAAAYRRERTTVSEVLSYAFGTAYDNELVSAPSWVTREPFDIQARLDDEQIVELAKLSRDDREQQMRLMMQSMLAERFHLTYHFETHQLQMYRLEIAKGGFKCPADPDAPPAIADPSRPRFRWSTAPPPPPRDAPVPAPQPLLHMRTRGWPFWLLVTTISHQPELEGRPLVDGTGLDQPYDCQLEWSHGGSDEPGDSLFTAVQKQLGLTLRLTKGPVEVLVIDSIQHPTIN